jgi:hypothetical protein
MVVSQFDWQGRRADGPRVLVGFLLSALAGFVVAGLIYFVGTESTGEAIVGGGLVTVVFLAFAKLRQRRATRPQPPTPVDPATLPPPTLEELRLAAEKAAWGDRRYQARSAWNDDERQAYLLLRVRGEAPSLHYRVVVFDPSGHSSETEAGQAVSQGSVTEVYPKHFRPEPHVSGGSYTVVWYVLVSDGGTVAMQEVDRDQFDVPPGEPATS